MAAAPKTVSILGSTGSVGQNTVDLIAAYPQRYKVVALTAQNNVTLLAAQAKKLNAGLAVIGNPDLYADLKAALAGTPTEVSAGPDALIDAASRPADWIMSAIVGIAGLRPTLTAIGQGGTVALANKESLVCAGPLMMAAVARHGTTLLPVDSEHNAVFQVLDPRQKTAISRIILTASGGPFLRHTLAELAAVTPAEALKHPTWSMGAKISIDSATMMNKALEVIEAMYIFDLPMHKIEVRIHPQSLVHAMVEYIDGSILTQMAAADMRTPIAHTLAWPERLATTGQRFDLNQNIHIDFEMPDLKRFQALELVRSIENDETGMAIALNAANEVAVAQFLAGKRHFDQIVPLVRSVMTMWPEISPGAMPATIDDVFTYDGIARALAESQGSA